VPAVSIVFNAANGSLLLQGNNKNDNIYITDSGNGNLTINATGLGILPVFGVKSIQDTGKGGNDQVFYTLVGKLTNPLTLSTDLGDGKDKFTADFNRHELAAGCALRVNMGANDDKVFLNNIGQVDAGNGFDFQISGNGNNDQLNVGLAGNVFGQANFNLSGNQDFDHINFNAFNNIGVRAGARLTVRSDDDTQYDYNGEVDGLLEIFLKGPSNEDTFSAGVTAQRDTNGITGVISGFVNGGSDDDKLTFIVNNNAGAFTSLAGLQANGEGGRDKCTITPNIVPFGCEKVQFA
jgi:hypothetical protein